jgi:hypothetical protein
MTYEVVKHATGLRVGDKVDAADFDVEKGKYRHLGGVERLTRLGVLAESSGKAGGASADDPQQPDSDARQPENNTGNPSPEDKRRREAEQPARDAVQRSLQQADDDAAKRTSKAPAKQPAAKSGDKE